MNYKIEIQNQEQADEAEKMAATLGYEMDTMFSEKWSDKYCYLLLCKDMSAGFGCEKMTEGDKPMAFDELRDLVVLKRNDVGDATHRNAMYPYVKLSDGWYYFDESSKWLRSTGGQPSYYDKLKPIEKPMKEYLIPNDGNYKYQKAYPITAWKEWIEIPEGAEAYTTIGLRHFTLSFYKDNFSKYCNNSTGFEWVESHSELSERKGFRVLWQRATQPEELPFVDDEWSQIPESMQDSVNHPSHNHYFIDVSDVNEIDFYEIALRYNVTDPCIQHILKKCLAVGNRGHKDFHTDLKDIHDTAVRALRIHVG